MSEQNLEKINNDVSPSEELTPEAVWDLLTFAEGYMGLNSLVPIGANRLNVDSLSSSLTGLDTAMRGVAENPEALITYGHSLELESQVYRKLLSYLGNLLSFDFTYVSSARNGDTDYSSRAFRRDLDEVRNFFDRFQYKKEFVNVTRQLLRNETWFGVPRLDGEKIFLQELPREFCKITGVGEYSYRFAFNFSYFDGRPEMLVGFPDYFTETYSELVANKPPTRRRKSPTDKWVEIPTNIGFMFKFNLDTLSQVPVFSGLYKDLANQALMRSLQKNSDVAAATKLIIGQVGRIKDAQSKTGNNFDTDARLLGQFMSFMKSALGDSVKLAALPLEQIQPVLFPAEKDLYKDYLKTTLATSGINSNLIFADSDNRPNAIETQLSLGVDEQMMTALYPQFESFLEIFVNLFTKKYQFSFKFEGTGFFPNKKQRLDSVTNLMNYGVLMPQKIASAMSMSPFDFYRQIDEARANGFAEKLTQLINKSPASQSDPGRPALDDGDLGNDGADTRASGGNIEKGGTL